MTTIRIEKSELIKLLTIGGQFAGKNKAMPILDSSLMNIKDNTIEVSSFDGENKVSVKGNLSEPVENELNVLVSSKDIIDYVKLIPSDIITCVVNDDVTKMKIKHKSGNTIMPLLPSDEFPATNNSEYNAEISVKSDMLRKMIGTSKDFVANDELRPIMNGLHFYFDGNKCGICGTDSHKLINIEMSDDSLNFGSKIGVNVNNKAFQAINTICGVSDYVSMSIADNVVKLVADNMTLVVRLIEGNYPAFKSVIPQNNDIKVVINKDMLMQSIQRASVSRSVVSSMIVFDIKDGVLNIKASSTDTGKEGSEKMSVESDAAIEIGMRYEMLMSCLNAIETEDVLIEMKDPTRAILFKDIDKDDKVVLLMPVRIY